MPRKNSRINIIIQHQQKQQRRGRRRRFFLQRMTMAMLSVLMSSSLLRQGSRMTATTTARRNSILVSGLQISPRHFRQHAQPQHYFLSDHATTLPSFFQQQQQQRQQLLSLLSNTRRYSSAASTNDNNAAAAATTKKQPLLPHYLENLNEPQTKAVTQPRTCITRVVAGPGSGKTRVLTCRIAHLLLTSSSDEDEGDDHDNNDRGGGGNKNTERVLAVTFTRKAAGEMQQRVEQLLLDYTSRSNDDDNDDDGNDYTDAAAANFEIIQQEEYVDPNAQQQRNKSHHHHFLQRVTLGTFHSVCAKILRWNGQLLSQLPSVQQDLQQSGGGGDNNNDPSSVGGVLDGSFTIIDQTEQLKIVRECLADLNMSEATKDETKPMAILDAIMKIKLERSYGGEQQQQQTPRGGEEKGRPPSRDKQVALKIYPRYRQQVLSTNRVDFDDLLLLTRELLLYHDDVRQRCQRFWTHVLVDEFQDTSQTQLDLVRLLTTRSLFVVGDADQAIYSWRGAHVGSLTDFFQQAKHHFGQDVQTVHLMENYRSTSNIVQAAQKVISSSSSSSSSSRNQKNGQSEQTAPLGQVVNGVDQSLRQDMKPKRGAGPAPRIVACENAEGEAKFVAETIRDAMDSNKYGNSDSHNNKKSSVALIYRTNAQSRALEEACVKYNLPYVIFGSATSFYKRREILDCLCFLRWIYNGRDRSAMLRAMKTPSRGIGDVAQEEFEEYCALVADASNGDAEYKKPTPLDILISLSDEQSEVAGSMGVPPPTDCISSRALKPLLLLSQQMRTIRELAYQQPVEIVLSYIIDSLDLLSHFNKYSQSKTEFEERKGNVQELQEASRRYTNQGPCLRLSDNGNDKIQSDDDIDDDDMNVEFATSPLGTFLDDISLVTETADELQKGNDQRSVVVCLMTIHASKGMEFDQVFLVGNEDGIFPTSQAIKEGEGSVALEEEKRLCYVAITRAKTELCLTWRREVPIFTSNGIVTKSFDRSRFLDVLASKKKKKHEGQVTDGTAQTMNQSSKSPRSALLPSSSPKQSQRRDYSSSAWSSRPASDFQGTNSVYGINRPSAATSPSRPSQSKTSSSQQPWQKKGSGGQKSPTLSGVRQPPSWSNSSSKGPELPVATRNSGPQTSPSPSSTTKKEKKRKSNSAAYTSTTPPPDSTWFFPVGSSVMHKELGRGIVLQPPPSPPPPSLDSTSTNTAPRDGGVGSGDSNVVVDLLVRVKFPESGVERHFSARGSEITPILI